MPQVAREFNIGSPTRLEMGQLTGPGTAGAATATQAHEVPVPNTPRVNVGNGVMPNPFGFYQSGQQIPDVRDTDVDMVDSSSAHQ